ncbi:restriction endonuclease subunit S [Vibrio parahaemolyticus]|nr:restriction endonuclease subunit S [Vibrio parahaemolyticus]
MSFEIKKATLGDFLNFKNGKKSPERADNASFPVFGSNGLIGRAESTNCPENTIVIGRVGSYCGSVHFSKEKCWVSDNAISCSSKNAGEEHFWFYVLTKLNLNQFSSGSGQPLLNQATLNAVECKVPNNSPLRALIGSVLNDYDKKIKLNAATNQTLEEMAQAIFKSWFVDFDPVKAKMNGEQPEGMDAATASLFPEKLVESELGLIPDGWELTNIGKVSECFDKKRIPLSKRQREQKQGSIPYYGATSVMDYVDEAIFDDIYLLIGEDGSVMKDDGTPFIQYIWGPAWVNNHAHVLQGIKSVSTEQLMLFFQQTNINAYVTGAVQLKINQRNMNSIPFIKAPKEINERFYDVVAPLYAKIRAIKEENEQLAKLRDTLLPKLLSGEIELGETEEMAEVN